MIWKTQYYRKSFFFVFVSLFIVTFLLTAQSEILRVAAWPKDHGANTKKKKKKKKILRNKEPTFSSTDSLQTMNIPEKILIVSRHLDVCCLAKTLSKSAGSETGLLS